MQSHRWMSRKTLPKAYLLCVLFYGDMLLVAVVTSIDIRWCDQGHACSVVMIRIVSVRPYMISYLSNSKACFDWDFFNRFCPYNYFVPTHWSHTTPFTCTVMIHSYHSLSSNKQAAQLNTINNYCYGLGTLPGTSFVLDTTQSPQVLSVTFSPGYNNRCVDEHILI